MKKKVDEGRDQEENEAGLCARCVWSRVVVSDRGSRFWLCERGVMGEAGFVKYPRLPVVRCGGLGSGAGTAGRFWHLGGQSDYRF